jgi:hypothetical protein
MALNKDTLLKGIKELYNTNSADAALIQWDKLFKDYFFEHNIAGVIPKSSGLIKPLFEASIKSQTFIQDFGKNLASWASSVVWNNNKSAKVPAELDFKGFSDEHKNDTDTNVYINALAEVLHNWFMQFTSF